MFVSSSMRIQNYTPTFLDYIIWCLEDGSMSNLDKKPQKTDCIHQLCYVPFLTMLIHVLSVTRPFSPEGNYRLSFCLLVQCLHAACGIGTEKQSTISDGIRAFLTHKKKHNFSSQTTCIFFFLCIPVWFLVVFMNERMEY